MRHDGTSMTSEQRAALFGRTMNRASELRAAERRRHLAVRTLPTVALALGLSAAVVAVATTGGGHRHPATSHAAGTGTSTAPRPHATTATSTTSTSTTLPAPIISGFDPISFSAVSLAQWWVLGTAPCQSGRCSEVLATSDGGAHFSVHLLPGTLGQVSGIAFGNSADGFVYGPGLAVTTDGGATWTAESMPGEVSELQIAGGRADALVRCSPSSAGCQGQIQLFQNALPGFMLNTPFPGGSWRAVTLPEKLTFGASLSVQGTTVLVSNGPASSTGAQPVDFLLSTDGGSSFSVETSPCNPGLGGRGELAISDPAVIWAACPTGMMASPSLSTDAGATWSPVRSSTEFSNGLDLAPVSATTALAWPAGGQSGVALTTDGGTSFQTVLTGKTGSFVTFAGYSDPSRAYVIFSKGTGEKTGLMYESNDGGHTWTQVSFRS